MKLPSREQCLEWANRHFIKTNNLTKYQIEHAYAQAYREGAEAMREEAASVAFKMAHSDEEACEVSEAIRNLKVGDV